MTPACPLFGDIYYCQIQHFKKAVIGKKNALVFCDLPELAIKTFDGVGGVNLLSNLFGILKIGG